MRLFKKRTPGLKPIHHDATVIPHLLQLPPPSRPAVQTAPKTRPRRHVVPQSTPEAVPTQYVLQLADGQQVPVRGHCLVGRLKPTSLDGVDSYATVDDSSGMVSRRHFEFGQTQDGSCWIMDARSANSTYLVTEGSTQRLGPLANRPLTVDDEIQFGAMRARLIPVVPEQTAQPPATRRARRARRAREA